MGSHTGENMANIMHNHHKMSAKQNYLLDEFHKTSQSLPDPQISLYMQAYVGNCRPILHFRILLKVPGIYIYMFDHFEEKAKEKLPVEEGISMMMKRNIEKD